MIITLLRVIILTELIRGTKNNNHKSTRKRSSCENQKDRENLGEGSYISVALVDCLEDTEQNIDYEAAFSMKQKAIDTEKSIKEA